MKKHFILILFGFISFANAQDFANLDRFRSDNIGLMKKEINDPLVVFMGNSITEGWLNKKLNFFDNPSFVNRGISGQTTSQMLLRFRQDVIDLKPKAVVILAGINDIAQNQGPIAVKDIFGNLKSMCELAKTNSINVVLCSVLPAKEFPWRMEINPIEKVAELNSLLKDYANQNNIIYVDYYEKLVTKEFGLPSDLTSDEVHLTIKGYQTLEPIVMKGINKALNN
ncbi:GDSL-type esterase/lipase family protein [Flavobacteriaceae sp. LMIT009]